MSNENSKTLDKKETKEKKRKNLFRINSDSKRRIMTRGDGGVCGVFSPVSDVTDGVTVDTNAGDGAVDLKSRLEIEDGAVKRETHDDHRRRRCWALGGFIFFRRRRKWTTAFEVVAGKGGILSLATHRCVV